MPGKYYVYIPFASKDTGGNAELVEAVKSWRNNRLSFNSLQDIDSMSSANIQHLKRKVPTVLVRGEGAKVLSILATQDPSTYTLYIMAHCNVGRNTVFNIQGVYDPSRTTLTAQQLVQRLIDDGIPPNVMNVKLFACLGGQDSKDDVAFGAKLYKELCTRGFYLVKLTAYQAPLRAATVDASTGHKRTQDDARPSSVKKTWGPPQLQLTPLGLALMKQLGINQ